MEEKGVWQIKTKALIPPNRKLIGVRWVLARKDDGRYRARCVAKQEKISKRIMLQLYLTQHYTY
jgi:hypothetical protein